MRPFGWEKWKSLFRGFKKGNRHSIERHGLAYLHSSYSLEALAHAVARRLGINGRHCAVSIESIWIDGTPQAEAKAPSGSPIKCELADLLVILEKTDSANVITHEIGLLVQAKATPKYNKLTSGSSTKKERLLLEGMDRSQPISLYKGTSSNLTSIIGTYNLGGIPFGLSDCSRYLLMPKFAAWFYFLEGRAPFQVGWPKTRASPYLHRTKSILEAIQQMALLGNIGKTIVDPAKCEWSRLVNDLRGNYSSVQMAGYGGQSRINNSSTVLSFRSNQSAGDGGFVHKHPPGHPPIGHDEKTLVEGNTPPSISVVKIKIKQLDGDDRTA